MVFAMPWPRWTTHRPERLEAFDAQQARALGGVLGGALPADAVSRATCAAADGGLGIRRAADLRYPAFLASRAEARGLAEEVLDAMPAGWRAAVLGSWDASSASALAAWRAELPMQTGEVAAQILQAGSVAALGRAGQLAGRLPSPPPAGPPRPFGADALLAPAGADDPERPEETPGLQARLADMVARLRLESIEAALEDRRDVAGLALLADLRNPGTDHGWLWELAGAGREALLPSEFLTAVRLRLGAPVFVDPGPCARCGVERGISSGHALCCAPGEATRGHNRIRDVLLGLASLSDGAACAEAPGLIAGAPLLRPADVLTSAAFGRQTALDVSIVAPHAAGAGADAAAARVVAKVQRYRPHLAALAADGVAYRPLVWTAWGRPHPDAAAAVSSMAAAAGRRLGVPAHTLHAKARTAMGVAIWRRAARMVAACGPRLAREDVSALLPAAARAARARHGGLDPQAPDDDAASDSDPAVSPVACPPPPALILSTHGAGAEAAMVAAQAATPDAGIEEEGALGEEWAEAIAGVVASGFAAAAASLGGATAAPPAGFGVTESAADARFSAEEEELSGAAAAESVT